MGRTRRKARYSAFGRAVENWRAEHGLSQAVVARLIGSQQRTLSGWLGEGGLPGAVLQIARLAALMGTDVHALVGDEGRIMELEEPEFIRALLARSISRRVAQRYLALVARAQERDGAAHAPGVDA
jgi:transcriptional regulator with XRE-family HTH domain